MRLIQSLIILMALVCITSAVMLVVNVPYSDYVDVFNPVFVRIKTRLPTLLWHVSLHSLFVLLLLSLYVFLDRKNSSLCFDLIGKLEALTPSLQTGFSLANNNRKFVAYLSLYSLGVVALRNWSSVVNGYFKYDDFEFFSGNRTEPFLSLLVMPHGDHLLPLYRLEVAAMNLLFGVNPLYYNLFVSFLFVMLLVFAGLLLREFGASQFAVVIFSTLCICWVDWGEMVAGYFCISVYVQIVLLTLIAIWAYFRWAKTHVAVYRILSVLSVGAALFLDVSGAWAPLGVVIFSLGALSRLTVREWFKSHQWLLVAMVVLYVTFLLLNYFVFFTGGDGRFLSMSGAFKHSVFSFVSQMFYMISGGLLLTPLFPIGYHLVPQRFLVILLAALLIIFGFLLFNVMRCLAAEVRWRFIAVLIIICITVLFVVIGRPMPGFDYALATKYTGVPYIWFCLLVSLIWDHYWQRAKLPGKKKIATATMLFLLFFVGHQYFFDSILYAYQAEIAGYKANIAEAELRRKNIDEIRERLILPLFESDISDLHIPALDGNRLYNVYPKLWMYNLSHYADFIIPEERRVVFIRNKAMQEWRPKDVITVSSLRSDTDGRFINLLVKDTYFQRMYLSPVELKADTVSGAVKNANLMNPEQFKNSRALSRRSNGAFLLESDGTAEVSVEKSAWDPEKKHILVLNVEYLGNNRKSDVKLDVHFSGELSIPYSKNHVAITAGKQSNLEIDLLQLYSYSLNSRVGDLRICFGEPGMYLVSAISLR